MSISSIGGGVSGISSLQTSGTTSVNNRRQDNDGDSDGGGGRVSRGAGRFASAINQALTQLGINTDSNTDTSSAVAATSSSSETSATNNSQDPQQALAAFAQSLFAALHAANGQQNNSGTSGNSTSGNAVSGVNGQGGHHHGGAGRLENSLQNLIQQLSSSSGSSSSSSSTDSSGSSSSTSSSSTSNSSLDALQQSFSSLLAAEGKSGSGATLNNFLQTLAQNLHGTPPTGNVVSTQA